MKNKKILLAMLAIALVFGMTACKEDGEGSGNNNNPDNGSGGSGGLTITGLDAYEGKYVDAYSSSAGIFCCQDVKNPEYLGGVLVDWEEVPAKITGEKATLNVYTGEFISFPPKIYTYSDTCDLNIYIHNTPVASSSARGYAEGVVFTNGKASVDASGVTFTDY
jgi:hypothetical protein